MRFIPAVSPVRIQVPLLQGTNYFVPLYLGPVVKRLRHRPFTAVSRVRFSSGSCKKITDLFSDLFYLLSKSDPFILYRMNGSDFCIAALFYKITSTYRQACLWEIRPAIADNRFTFEIFHLKRINVTSR